MNEPTKIVKRTGYWQVGLIVLLLVLVACSAYYFGSRGIDSNAPISQTPVQSGNMGDRGMMGQNTQTAIPIKVYFAKDPDSNNDPSIAVAVNRSCPDMGVARCAITELLKGPNSEEKAQGLFTPVKLSGASTCNGPDFMLTISNGFAKLQFCRQLELTGVLADARIQTTIEKSLKQFSSVSKVAILDQSGNCPLDMTGENRCLTQ